MGEGDQRGRSPVINEWAQRPTKSLLTLGTRDYDDLCCAARICVATTEDRRSGPPGLLVRTEGYKELWMLCVGEGGGVDDGSEK